MTLLSCYDWSIGLRSTEFGNLLSLNAPSAWATACWIQRRHCISFSKHLSSKHCEIAEEVFKARRVCMDGKRMDVCDEGLQLFSLPAHLQTSMRKIFLVIFSLLAIVQRPDASMVRI